MTTKAPNAQKKPRKKITYISAPLPTEGSIRKPSVIAVLGISKTTFDDGVRAGKFPKGQLIGARIRVWNVAVVRQLLAELEKGGPV